MFAPGAIGLAGCASPLVGQDSGRNHWCQPPGMYYIHEAGSAVHSQNSVAVSGTVESLLCSSGRPVAAAATVPASPPFHAAGSVGYTGSMGYPGQPSSGSSPGAGFAAATHGACAPAASGCSSAREADMWADPEGLIFTKRADTKGNFEFDVSAAKDLLSSWRADKQFARTSRQLSGIMFGFVCSIRLVGSGCPRAGKLGEHLPAADLQQLDGHQSLRAWQRPQDRVRVVVGRL